MLELFNMYKSSGSYAEALMVGRNLFNKNPSSAIVFNEYFDLLCSQARCCANTIAGRRQFISQAEVALAFFSENAELDMTQVEQIKACESQLTTIVKEFNKEIDSQNTLVADKISEQNNEILKLLDKLCNKLQTLDDRREFDKVLEQIGGIDDKFDKDAFDLEQQRRYTRLTKLCTETINKKLAVFEHNENVKYNKQAIEAYKRVFDFFRANEYDNKNHKMIIKDFFAFDTSRLFNETLVYYNHIYSYVLSKMTDDEKFILTKYAIMSERKQG